jgi:hypothetical protein
MLIDGEIGSVVTDPQSGESQFKAVKAQTTARIEFDDGITIELPLP